MNGQENGSNVNPSSVDAVTESRDFSTKKNETATIKINNGNAINADKNKTGAGFKKKPTRHLIFEGYEGGKRIAKKEVGANVVEEQSPQKSSTRLLNQQQDNSKPKKEVKFGEDMNSSSKSNENPFAAYGRDKKKQSTPKAIDSNWFRNTSEDIHESSVNPFLKYKPNNVEVTESRLFCKETNGEQNHEQAIDNPADKGNNSPLSQGDSKIKSKASSNAVLKIMNGNNQFNSSFNFKQQMVFDSVFTVKNDRDSMLSKILSLHYNKYYLDKRKKPRSRLSEMERNTVMKQSLYYKPTRLEFKKTKQIFYGPMKAPRSSVRYFCKMLKNPNAIAFLCLNRERERDGSKPNLKCNRILLDEDDKFSPSVAIDYNYSRIFCFSNLYHQIYVYSMSSGNKIVNIAVQNQLFHPILYIYSVYQRNFLIVIGGYVEDKRKTIAEGSNTIQIYEVSKWEVSLKPKIIKLILGRISPILIPHWSNSEDCKLLIIGGHTSAAIKKGKLNFLHEKEVNESTNLTGAVLQSGHIVDAVEDEVVLYNTLTVYMDDPMNLHSAFVMLNSPSAPFLLIPNSKKLLRVSIFSNQVNITYGKYNCELKTARQSYEQMQINYDKELKMFRISEEGLLKALQMNVQSGGQKEKCCLLI